jgi:hypothetical protein
MDPIEDFSGRRFLVHSFLPETWVNHQFWNARHNQILKLRPETSVHKIFSSIQKKFPHATGLTFQGEDLAGRIQFKNIGCSLHEPLTIVEKVHVTLKFRDDTPPASITIGADVPSLDAFYEIIKDTNIPWTARSLLSIGNTPVTDISQIYDQDSPVLTVSEANSDSSSSSSTWSSHSSSDGAATQSSSDDDRIAPIKLQYRTGFGSTDYAIFEVELPPESTVSDLREHLSSEPIFTRHFTRFRTSENFLDDEEVISSSTLIVSFSIRALIGRDLVNLELFDDQIGATVGSLLSKYARDFSIDVSSISLRSPGGDPLESTTSPTNLT